MLKNNFLKYIKAEVRVVLSIRKKKIKLFKNKIKIELSQYDKGIFIDCGAYDGCSIILFKLANPEFDCISFEPNPILWKYFKKIPTQLIKKGVFDKSEKKDFFIDHIDEDGSSVIPTKKIIFDSNATLQSIKSIEIECIDLSELIVELEKKYQCIVLKLDVEGAEYDILEDLIKKKLLGKINKLYVEFHWKKCNFSEERHTKLISDIESLVKFENWDALDFAVHNRSKIQMVRRNIILKQIAKKS